jgi:transposase
MVQHKRQYTKEFKLEAIRLYENGNKSVRQVEQDLGITAGLLNKWRGQQQTGGPEAFVGSGHQTDLESEVRRLKRENEVLRQERDILKKALVVFSKDGVR